MNISFSDEKLNFLKKTFRDIVMLRLRIKNNGILYFIQIQLSDAISSQEKNALNNVFTNNRNINNLNHPLNLHF